MKERLECVFHVDGVPVPVGPGTVISFVRREEEDSVKLVITKDGREIEGSRISLTLLFDRLETAAGG